MNRRRRRYWLMGAGGVLVLVVAAGLTVFFLFRDRATPVEAGEVGATLVTGAGAPGDFGLYHYATSGFETTDALAGSRHDYPAETYLTIQPGGCGSLVRWQALEERWDEWDFCPDGSLAGWQAYHEWFNVPNLEVWTCSPPIPTQGEPGENWTGTCTRPEGRNVAAGEDVIHYEVLGYETLTVGSEPVETLRVRTTSLSRGGSEASDTSDTWILPGTQLVVRQVTDDSSTSRSAIGPVQYHEEYEVHLVSLYPSS